VDELSALKEAVVTGNPKLARQVVDQALAAGAPAADLVSGALVPAMAVVGDRFECGEYFVPELLLAARAMKAAFEPLEPLLAASGVRAAGRVVIGTVKGDLHDIGKNLVAAMLKGAGFEVVDLGTDVAPAAFVEAARGHAPDVVALSALLSTTLPGMKGTIEALEDAGLRRSVRVIIGGAPVTDAFARAIGADGYSDSAVGAVTLVRRLMGPST
jgi:5-methyltetrahydrofolate--homocysteine methyltransferase